MEKNVEPLTEEELAWLNEIAPRDDVLTHDEWLRCQDLTGIKGDNEQCLPVRLLATITALKAKLAEASADRAEQENKRLRMDNFTDDASPKAGVPTGSGAVGFTTQTDLRQYRQIRQTLLYGAELAKRYVGNESSVTAPGAYYMRDTRVPKAMKNLAALMMDLELIKRDRDDLKAMLAKGSFRRTAEAHYDAWMGLANAALDIADKLPPEMGLSADTMRMFAERIRLQGQWLRATPPLKVGTPAQAESPGDEVQKGKP